MKKFLIILSSVILLILAWDTVYYRFGWYIDLHPEKDVTTFVKTEGDKIYIDKGDGYESFEIRGVNLGSGEPGEWSTDFDIDKETYLRWFKYIKELGANTIRIYTIQQDIFYEAFYEYNKDNPDPLYVIHGVWVNDYVQNSHRDAYSKDFYDTFLNDCKTMIDVVHGNKKLSLGRVASAGSGSFVYDISEWVIGYILGVEWDDLTVAYTDDTYGGKDGYTEYVGEYMYTTEEASPFEVMLCKVGDKVMEYESERYKNQKLVAFSNWPTTDPFEYSDRVKHFFMKCAYVDVEHIKTTDNVISGQFASYHVYPYYPDYLSYTDDWSQLGITDKSVYINEKGQLNTYRAYLSMLTAHHSIPVVISEFGVSTGRGIAQEDSNTGRNQGNMSEKDQGQAILDCYSDIMAAGCAGSCVFSWQDEWFKRTWNTMYAVDMTRTPYWSDYQTNEQYFGLLSFDPGIEQSVCYVDGDVSEWSEKDFITQNDGLSVSVKYDEKFIYFLVHKPNLDLEQDTIYLPMDITPKSGSYYCKNQNLLLDRAADFLIVLNGKENSRVLVQEYYESIRSTYSQNVYNFDSYVKENLPEIDSPLFIPINLVLKLDVKELYVDKDAISAELFETGKLKYGNANPKSPDFDSLADFMECGDYIEIKLPWQLLNFADPSRMKIHDDYYDGNYGIEYIQIDEMFVGIAATGDSRRVPFSSIPLQGWGNKVTYHERLKSSYYILQKLWTKEDLSQ